MHSSCVFTSWTFLNAIFWLKFGEIRMWKCLGTSSNDIFIRCESVKIGKCMSRVVRNGFLPPIWIFTVSSSTNTNTIVRNDSSLSLVFIVGSFLIAVSLFYQQFRFFCHQRYLGPSAILQLLTFLWQCDKLGGSSTKTGFTPANVIWFWKSFYGNIKYFTG